MFGTAMAGGVTVALNTFSTEQELQFQLRQSDVEVLIMEAGVASNDFVATMFALCPGAGLVARPGNYCRTTCPSCAASSASTTDKARPGLQDWDDFLALGAENSDVACQGRRQRIQPGGRRA